MRISTTLLALALASAPLASTHAQSVVEKQRPHAVEVDELIDRPTAFLGMRVRFHATFVQTAALFDTFHTGFTPHQYLNMVVWDDDAAIWDPEVRADPLLSLYYEKTRDGAHTVSQLRKYTQVEIVGEVVSDFRSTPWINVHEVVPLAERGALSDNSVYHVERAGQLVGEGARTLADQHYGKALATDVPVAARIDILKLRADNQLAAQDWDAAVTTLTEAVELSEGVDAEARYLLARALSEAAEDRGQGATGNDADAAEALFAAAVEHAGAAVELEPEMGDAYAVLGISLAGLERFAEAKIQCERAIRLLPENAEVRWYLGRILNRQGDYDQAISVLKDAIDRAPKDHRLHKSIARSYFERGQTGGSTASSDIVTALREYDIAIRLHPDDADLHHYSGRVLEYATDRGQEVRIGLKRMPATYEMAIERFQAALAVDETYTDAHVRLGARYRHKEAHDRAVEHYQRALELAPERDGLYGTLGSYLWDLGRREEAYAVYQGHQERNPEYIDTLYALGRLSLELDQDARAVTWLQDLLEVAPEHAMAHADLTESLYEVGEYRASLEHAERALALLDDTRALRVHRFAGLAHWAQDAVEATITHLDGRVAGVDDPRLPLALGWALTTRDDTAARVQQLANAALELDPEADGGRELLAWGRYLAGEYPAAEATLRPLYTADPDHDVYAYRLGMAIFRQGATRYADAVPLLEQGTDVRGRDSLLDGARSQADDALDVIEEHVEALERQRREAERARREAEEG